MLASQSRSSRQSKVNPNRIESRGSNPPGRQRFSRSSANTSTATIEKEPNKLSVADICRQMLGDGFVQSYIDFYHMMHRSEPVVMPYTDMIFIRNHLVRAEDCRRSGNTKGVHQSYIKLATLYSKAKDWKTAIFFYEKCYEISLITSDKNAEMAANHSLGMIYQHLNDISTARKFHERHEEIARSVDNTEEVAKANIELYKVCFLLAQQLDEEDKLDEALALYIRCLDASRLSMSREGEAESSGKVGNLLMRKGDMAAAIPYLRQYSQVSSELDDAESRCRASSALAAALDSLGMSEKALVELKLVSSISEQAGDALVYFLRLTALLLHQSSFSPTILASVTGVSRFGNSRVQSRQVR